MFASGFYITNQLITFIFSSRLQLMYTQVTRVYNYYYWTYTLSTLLNCKINFCILHIVAIYIKENDKKKLIHKILRIDRICSVHVKIDISGKMI